jgi:hypothetical protein
MKFQEEDTKTMNTDFTKMITENRLTSEHIQTVYEALSNYSAADDPAGLLSRRYLTSALFFAAQLPLSGDGSFRRGEIHSFLKEKNGLPEKEADVLCTMLCSVLAVAFPIFSGPADPVKAQESGAVFTLNPDFVPAVDSYRVLAGLNENN